MNSFQYMVTYSFTLWIAFLGPFTKLYKSIA